MSPGHGEKGERENKIEEIEDRRLTRNTLVLITYIKPILDECREGQSDTSHLGITKEKANKQAQRKRGRENDVLVTELDLIRPVVSWPR